jgi:nucleoside-diphosphate-sugar epimerase
MKKAIVTGSEGFIGSALCHRLRRDGVAVAEYDLKLGADLKTPVEFPQADVVFHLAGCSDAHQAPASCFRENVLTTLNILDGVHSAGMRLVFASTYLDSGAYALSKRCGERMVEAYAQQYGLNASVVRCCNVYGPGDRNTSRLVPSLITKMLARKPVQVTTCRRDFVYIDDVVDAYVRIATDFYPSSTYGISGTGLIDLPAVARRLSELTGYDKEIGLTDMTAPDPLEQDTGCMSKLGWIPQVGLAEGLERTVAWCNM